MKYRPASQDTNTLRHTSSSTGHHGHTRRHLQHSSTFPKRLPDSSWTLCGNAHGKQADASSRVRNFSSLLRTRNSQQTIFEIRRLFSRSLETDELWPTHKRNAPQALHPRQRHRCGRLPAPPLAHSKACLQPTNSSSSRVAFRRFRVLSSLLKNRKATPVHENPRKHMNFINMRADRKTGQHQARQTTVRLSSPRSSPSPPLRQPVSTLEEAGLNLFEASSYPFKPKGRRVSLVVSSARPFHMSHHRRICDFTACKEDGTDTTVRLPQDDPARSLWLSRLSPDDQECSRKVPRVSRSHFPQTSIVASKEGHGIGGAVVRVGVRDTAHRVERRHVGFCEGRPWTLPEVPGCG